MTNAVATKKPHPLFEIRDQLDKRAGEFRAALPAHIPVERFMRVVITAVQTNKQLLDAPRREFFNAAVKAAQDGLLPDGREGALVCRPSRNGLTVTWQPMIAGIRKKARNSGEIATWDVVAVFENDDFEYELGDAPFIRHKPTLEEPGKPIAVYSIATLKTGEKSRDVMSIAAVEAIRNRSDAYKAFKNGKIKSTPWSTDYAEMAKKTVARRHSKVLPMSTDLDDLMRRDDELYDLKGAGDEVQKQAGRPSLGSRLDQLAAPKEEAAGDEDVDAETGEIIEGEVVGKDKAEDAAGNDDGDLDERAAAILDNLDHAPRGIDTDDPGQVVAYAAGMAAAEEGIARRAIPPDYRSKSQSALAGAWQRGHDYMSAAAAEDGEEDDAAA